jgi:hypothetical protein
MSNWTPEYMEQLRAHFHAGKTHSEIHRLMGGRFTVNAIRHKLSRLSMVCETRSEARRQGRADEKSACQRIGLIEANIWHLIDLKRAGHSPTRTELNVCSFGGPVRYSLPLADGISTSPAALCAEA